MSESVGTRNEILYLSVVALELVIRTSGTEKKKKKLKAICKNISTQSSNLVAVKLNTYVFHVQVRIQEYTCCLNTPRL